MGVRLHLYKNYFNPIDIRRDMATGTGSPRNQKIEVNRWPYLDEYHSD
jgi:hypothetical protein